MLRSATEQDAEVIRALLVECSLPTEDLTRSRPDFVVACNGSAIVGVAALERFGDTGLLRSVAVSPDHRGFGIGRSLVSHLELRAREVGLAELVLLTLTAREFFKELGYRIIEGQHAPLAVQSSEEFRSLCPQSAACLSKRLAAVTA
ncbi:MAG: arsenic resistance N-acetyltransferase ArsN2 [Steroidobacteraceae bacterium]